MEGALFALGAFRLNLLKAVRYATRAVHTPIDSRAREGARLYEPWRSVIGHWGVRAPSGHTACGCVAPPHPPMTAPTGNYTATRAQNVSPPSMAPRGGGVMDGGAIAGECCMRTAARVRSRCEVVYAPVSSRRMTMRHHEALAIDDPRNDHRRSQHGSPAHGCARDGGNAKSLVLPHPIM